MKMKLFSLYLDQETQNRLAALRNLLGRSAAEIIRLAVGEFFARHFGAQS